MNFSLQLTNNAFYPPNHKTHFSFALGCPQDFNFAQQFWYGRVETGLNRQNGWAKLKSYRHFRAKLKHDLQLGDLKASLINCAEKLIYKTSSNNKIILWCCFWIRPAEQHFTWAKNLLARSRIVIIKANHSSTSSDPSFGSISSICN